ncbi:unnamed protein product, partial [Didymodactylos carnosus]
MNLYEDEINTLIAQMTPEEKVGQMTQVTIDLILKNPNALADLTEVDANKLNDTVHKYKVGSILNVAAGGAYSLNKWHEIIKQVQDSANKTRLQIPILYGIDSIHGANYIQNALLFPQAIGLAATFNPELAHDIGKIVAHQTRAAGIPWNFYPVVDVGRQKLWSRLWETFGEDVKLVTDMGRAYLEGMQGTNLTSQQSVAGCLKHYAGYGFPLSGRDRTPAVIDERMMLEYFLPPFEEGVKAGALSVMINSGEVNGIPGHANHHLLTEILKNTWNFQGFTVSDWEDIIRLYTRDKTADSPKEAVRQAVMAGVDMSMVPFDFSFFDLAVECADDGTIPMDRIDDAVRRILRVKFALGLFDGKSAWPDTNAAATFNNPSFDATNLQAAQESITLLKNDGVLPLPKTFSKILVTGPAADKLTVLNGGWSLVWQGDREDLYPKNWTNKTILKTLRTQFGEGKIDYINGTDFDKIIDVKAVIDAAATADYILVCLGEKPYTETFGNIADLTLFEAQLEFVEQLQANISKPIIVVLVEGRPRIIRRIADISSAIIMMYLPGMEGGSALVDVLFGDYNPSGLLPFTYPKYPHLLTTYDYKWSEVLVDNKIDPQYEFGHGLSYTTFEYKNLKLSSTEMQWNGDIQISIDVANVGKLSGSHTVLLYVSDYYRSITPPNKQLKGFKKVLLQPTKSETVTFSLDRNNLSFIGIDNKRISEAGLFGVKIGDKSANFTLLASNDPVP